MVLVGVFMLATALTFVRVWGDAVCTEDMTKEIEGTHAKLIPLLVQGDTGYLELLEGGKKSLLVFLLVLLVDDDVVH